MRKIREKEKGKVGENFIGLVVFTDTTFFSPKLRSRRTTTPRPDPNPNSHRSLNPNCTKTLKPKTTTKLHKKKPPTKCNVEGRQAITTLRLARSMTTSVRRSSMASAPEETRRLRSTWARSERRWRSMTMWSLGGSGEDLMLCWGLWNQGLVNFDFDDNKTRFRTNDYILSVIR